MCLLVIELEILGLANQCAGWGGSATSPFVTVRPATPSLISSAPSCPRRIT